MTMMNLLLIFTLWSEERTCTVFSVTSFSYFVGKEKKGPNVLGLGIVKLFKRAFVVGGENGRGSCINISMIGAT